ncbi:MAG: hypothetical protein WAP20_06875 [Limnochordia bacterium]|nr:hypothetical protein [Bacillota bacterium]HOB08947.1 hypothetical protein [Limnochordia bacterium]NLH31894.1 hypothetical protein [Bacillota bacterium]HPT93169.1 hypothetical protein [Limnochordia bacterium]HPZ31105.1 hypothetical protein [Limnochordia bacterium]
MNMPIPPHLIYPLYTGIIAVAVVLLVPKQEIRRLFIYAVIFGGILNVAAITFNGLLGFGGHINFGPFGVGSCSFFAPLAWTLWFILFFWFLPEQVVLKVIYVISTAVYSMFFSNVLVNLEIFVWKLHRVFYPLFLYMVWFSIAVWGYQRVRAWLEQLE